MTPERMAAALEQLAHLEQIETFRANVQSGSFSIASYGVDFRELVPPEAVRRLATALDHELREVALNAFRELVSKGVDMSERSVAPTFAPPDVVK